MKTLKPALLMVLLTGSVAAQDTSNTSAAPDVTVLKVSWRKVDPPNPRLSPPPTGGSPDYAQRVAVNQARMNEHTSARNSGLNPAPPVLLSLPSIPAEPPLVVRPFSGFIYEFTVQNNGPKTIRQVAFEYSFTDPETQRKIGRRNYKSNVKIRPGMTAKLVVRSYLRPVGTIDARQAGQNLNDASPEQVVIQKIKYDDGFVWQRPAQ